MENEHISCPPKASTQFVFPRTLFQCVKLFFFPIIFQQFDYVFLYNVISVNDTKATTELKEVNKLRIEYWYLCFKLSK